MKGGCTRWTWCGDCKRISRFAYFGVTTQLGDQLPGFLNVAAPSNNSYATNMSFRRNISFLPAKPPKSTLSSPIRPLNINQTFLYERLRLLVHYHTSIFHSPSIHTPPLHSFNPSALTPNHVSTPTPSLNVQPFLSPDTQRLSQQRNISTWRN